MKISLIAAIGEKNQIGYKGAIPWTDPKDLKRFKYLTLGKTVVMGNKTYQSIGKALPGRHNIVVSRTQSDPIDAFCVTTPQQAVDLSIYLKTTEMMVIGGEELYRSFMGRADRMYLTYTKYDGPADTHFPEIIGEWCLDYQEDNGEFIIYNRRLGDKKI